MTQPIANVRPAAVAGTFYPAAAEALASAVEGCFAHVRQPHPIPKAIVAPHAGYVYSGAIAGTAYAPFRGNGAAIERVVLLGPSHRVAFRGLAVPSAEAFATPLGEIPVDHAAIAKIMPLDGVAVLDQAHAQEHSIEVHLPFLQRLFPKFSLVPIVVGEASAEAIDAVLAALWGGPETLVVVSSDLSHYHDYDAAAKLDGEASRTIEMLRPDLLRDEQACGRRPIRGLLRRAQKLDLRVTTIDLRNSGDTSGSKDRVVGYGAYAFEYAAKARLADNHRQTLTGSATMAIRYGLEHDKPPVVKAETFPRPLQAMRASFVTVKIGGKLRGCIGSLAPRVALIDDVVANAYKACFADPRFPALTPEEADRISIGVSVLSTAREIDFSGQDDLLGQLRPDIDGIILTEGKRRGLFLPQVWEGLPQPAQFLAHLKQKAGLKPDHWSDDIKAYRFTTETF